MPATLERPGSPGSDPGAECNSECNRSAPAADLALRREDEARLLNFQLFQRGIGESAPAIAEIMKNEEVDLALLAPV